MAVPCISRCGTAAAVRKLSAPAIPARYAVSFGTINRLQEPQCWRGLLGQNVIELADTDAVCEVIALTIGLGEGAVGLDEGLEDLRDVGSDAGPAVSLALAGIGGTRLELAAAPDDLDGPSGNDRL